jgi:hypothetical protein
MDSYVDKHLKFINALNDLEGTLTTVGAMMGDATSFPGMSLMSIFASEQAGFGTESGEFVGDDTLLGQCTPARRETYEAEMTSLGGVISAKKTFVHPCKGLICEQPVEFGIPQPFTLLSMHTAPPGGSKGEVNWVTQVSVIVDHAKRIGRSPKKDLWQFSPFRQQHRLAAALGLPVGAPPDLGGLGHPRFPRVARHMHLRWLEAISSLTLSELVTGTGLNPLPPSSTQLLRKMGKEYVDGLLSAQKDDDARKRIYHQWSRQIPFYRSNPAIDVGDTLEHEQTDLNIPLKDALEASLGPVHSWEFFHRGAPKENLHSPSILYTVDKFHRRVMAAPYLGKRFKTAETLRDIERKKNVYVAKSLTRLSEDRRRSYGLERAEFISSSRDTLDKPYSTVARDLGMVQSIPTRGFAQGLAV